MTSKKECCTIYTYCCNFVDRKVCILENFVDFDASLLARALQNDQEAYAKIIHYFYPIISSISSSYFLTGGDRDDLMQEGLIGLYRAVCSYDAGKNDNFVKYAKICIHRSILTAIKADARLKNSALNSSLPLSDKLGLQGESAEDAALHRERLLDVYERIEDELTALERQVLSLFIDGLSYKEIADRLGKNPKAVDNALSRIRGKLLS